MAEGGENKETAPGPSSAWPNSSKDYELKDVIGVGATAVVQVRSWKTKKRSGIVIATPVTWSKEESLTNC